MHVEKFGAGIFVIHGLLDARECAQYIEDSERIGYTQATIFTEDGKEEPYEDERNNGRILYDNPDLAQSLFERAEPLLPQVIDGWRVCGFNERFRFYRYQHQQYFKRHMDGTFHRSDSEESFLSFLIYLNEGFEGGCTDFTFEKIVPRAGSALAFPHRIPHQGATVTSGVKYVLRTDVMYRRG